MTTTDLRAEITASSRRQSPDWTSALFSMLSPDALVRGTATGIVGRLAEHGFAVQGFCVINPTGPQVDEMTAGQILRRGEVFRGRALDALFQLGPSIALALIDRHDRAADSRYAEAKQLKGAAPPTPLVPGTIRHDFGSVNTVLSLIHIADGVDDSEREAGLLVGARWWQDGNRLPAALDLLSPSMHERRGYLDVLASVHGRLLVLAEQALGPGWLPLPADFTSTSATDPQRSNDILAAVRATLDAVQAVGNSVRTNGVEASVLRVLRHRFTTNEKPLDIGQVNDLMRLLGSQLDPWERAVLETSQYFQGDVTVLPGRSGVARGTANG